MKSKEIWLPIPNYSNYEVSSFGRIKSVNYKRTGKTRILRFVVGKYGYLRTALISDDGIRKAVLIHRMVGITFIPNPKNKPMINHKNGVKDDNRTHNLEWCTRS